MPTRIEWLGEGGLEEEEDWKKRKRRGMMGGIEEKMGRVRGREE